MVRRARAGPRPGPDRARRSSRRSASSRAAAGRPATSSPTGWRPAGPPRPRQLRAGHRGRPGRRGPSPRPPRSCRSSSRAGRRSGSAASRSTRCPGCPPRVDVLALSDLEKLNLPAEARQLDAASITAYEAVRLFIARAVGVRPDFRVTNDNAPAVAGIAAQAPRDAARDRARRGPGQAPPPGRDPRAPRAPARRPLGRLARPAGAAADAPRRDRLEPRAARPRGAAAPRPVVGLRRRLRARRRRGRLRAGVGARRAGRPRRPDVPRRPEPRPGRGDRGRDAASGCSTRSASSPRSG